MRLQTISVFVDIVIVNIYLQLQHYLPQVKEIETVRSLLNSTGPNCPMNALDFRVGRKYAIDEQIRWCLGCAIDRYRRFVHFYERLAEICANWITNRIYRCV